MTDFRHPYLKEFTLGGQYRAFIEEPLPLSEILNEAKNGNTEQFLKIFSCFRTPSSMDRTCVQLMLEAIKMGKLEAKLEFISISPREGEALEAEGRGRTESAEHKGMKRWVRDFFLSKGTKLTEEISFLGYEVDVGSLKEQIFIECGDTEPHKVVEFLMGGLNIGILQYNSEEIVWFNPTPSFPQFAKKIFLEAI